MEKILKRFIIFQFMIIISLFLFSQNTIASVPYDSYIYNFWGEAIKAPQAYKPEMTLNGKELGVDSLNEPQDIFITEDDEIYILDSGNNRIIVLNKDYQLVKVIEEIDKNGSVELLNEPQGIFVCKNSIYIADTGNQRIIESSLDGKFKSEHEFTEGDIEEVGVLPPDFRFRPLKILVNEDLNSFYVIVAGVYDGIMEFTMEGSFIGFIGAPRVSPNPIDFLWQKIATEEQRERQRLYLPIEYRNFYLGKDGFIYAVEHGGAESDSIKKLNPSGEDILLRDGYHPPMGDLGVEANSRFVDIISRDNGIYSVLDRERGRIFTYNNLGQLLYIFGAKGSQRGTFASPMALAATSEKEILVVDSRNHRIEVFRPTNYTLRIHEAINLYHEGRYEQSEKKWREVLNYNANYDIAYHGIGNNYLRKDENEKALTYFRTANNRQRYSKAFIDYRRKVVNSNFSLILFFLILFIILLTLITKYKDKINQIIFTGIIEKNKKSNIIILLKKIGENLRYPFYLIFHPFGGFWELKHERKGNLTTANSILILVIITYIFMRQYTAFIFNTRQLDQLNIITEALSILVPFILWALVNWALTTLMEGKGTIKEIYIATAYALTPIIIINIPVTIISHFLTLEEGSFYYFFLSLAVTWAMALVFFGLLSTHDYTLTKALGATIMTVAGIVISILLFVFFFLIISQFVDFISNIVKELYYM